MPRAPPPSVLLKFQGRRDWPLDQGVDDWGLTPSQQESYVEQFRRILSAKNAWKEDIHDYFTLRRFLRARSYDLEKATTMWLNHLAWAGEFHVETILEDFYFGERDKFLTAYPQGYHKVDKMGRPVYIQLIGKINVDGIKQVTSEERMIKFHIQEYERCRKVILPICSRLAGRHVDTTFGILDVKGVGLSHMTGEVKRIMSTLTKYDQDNYPEMLGHICIINAPAVFRMIWSIVKTMLDVRTQSKIEILGTNYLDGLLQWVDIDSLPTWLGGRSTGTLVDDVGPWSDPELVRKLGFSLEELRLTHGLPPPPPPHLRAESVSSLIARNSALAAVSTGQVAGRAHSHTSVGSAAAGPAGAGALLVVGGPIQDGRISEQGGEGYHSPVTSSGEFAHRVGSLRHSSATQDALDDVQRRLALGTHTGTLSAGASRTNSHSGVMPEAAMSASAAAPPISVIPEAATSSRGPDRARTLVDRIAALERAVPDQMQRLKASISASGGGPAVGHSTRSAPEGSLLHRIEVLEEAMDTLMAAQQVTLQYQQDAVVQQQKSKPRESCCCCVM